MPNPDDPQAAQSLPVPVPQIAVSHRGVNIIEHEREWHVYRLTEPELDNLIAGFASIHLVLFGVAAGGLLGAIFGLLTSGSAMDAKTFAAYIATTLVCAGGTLYFGLMALRDRRRSLRDVGRLKKDRAIRP